jgi:UDP-perosamine 4-acetyltransferase
MSGDSRSLRLVVVGTGGHARVVLSILQLHGKYEITGLVDRPGPQTTAAAGEMILGHPVIGCWKQLKALRSHGVEIAALALGDAGEREMMQLDCQRMGYALPVLVHPTAFVDPSAVLGSGCQICAMGFVGPEAILGEGVIVNTGASVDHESRIGDFATLSPAVAVAGRCKIGARTFLGIGSKVSHGVSIGPGTRLGAGAIALADIAAEVLAVGIPARRKSAIHGNSRG